MIKQGFNGQYRFCSNFYPCEIEFEGTHYPTVEHAYQAAKTLDNSLRLTISEQATAAKAKALGRELKLREDWDDVKVSIMETLLRKKFYDPVLKFALLQTGDIELVEYNYWHDNFWGICTCARCKYTGENNLGRILMELRTAIQDAQSINA